MKTDSKLLNEWGKWLSETMWDYFSTITFKFDMKPNQSLNHLRMIEKRLVKLDISYKFFYVVEKISRVQSHIHMLLKGKRVKVEVDKYLKEKNLVNPKFVKHLNYDRSKGASYYIVKYIENKELDYDMIFSDDFLKD